MEIERTAMFSASGPAHAQDARQFYIDFVRAQPHLAWTTHNVIRPETKERNRPVVQAMQKLMNQPNPLPVVKALPRMGLDGFDHCRVLACDGASMLAWVGVMGPERSFSNRELQILRALLPHLRKRLLLERELTGASSATLLTAVLDALGSPAFVLVPNGTIAHANDLGIELWSREPRILAEQLRDARLHAELPSSFELTPLRYPGVEGHQLAIRRRPANDMAARVDAAVRRWTLTPRQHEVLGLVARGLTNKTIAAELGVAEITVEVHVSALLVKAQVANRAPRSSPGCSLSPTADGAP